MRRDKKDHLLLISFTLFVFLALATLYYAFGVLVPRKATSDFGTPDAQLEFSKKVLYALSLEANRNNLLLPYNEQGQKTIFQITYGESAYQVASNLRNSGIIRSQSALTDLLVYRGSDKQIQAGSYTLSPAMSAAEIAAHIVDSNPQDVAFSFLPGWRAEEIAALLPQSGLSISQAQFLALVKNPGGRYAAITGEENSSLEGFLYPDEYQVLRSAGADDLAEALSNHFKKILPENYADLVQRKGLSLYESVILASIVQKEMVAADEGPLIAGVFLNRLKAGMPLQSDPTVQYALGFDQASGSWWRNPLTESDLQTNSPYNTYLHPGLPPAPICNPGMTALMAVADAVDTPYLYFRAACDGSGRHIFSETYEEHLAAACDKRD